MRSQLEGKPGLPVVVDFPILVRPFPAGGQPGRHGYASSAASERSKARCSANAACLAAECVRPSNEAMPASPPSTGHVVLATADSDCYRSLQRRPTSRPERFKLGRSLRQQVPRSSMGQWKAPAKRPDPVELIKQSHEGRLNWLIPIRVGRMVASPYGFLRGTAVVMAEDVARLPATGITPVDLR